MTDGGFVRTDRHGGIASVTFSHPKSNSLPGNILRDLAEAVTACGQDERVRVVVLRSEGEKAFCAGASFDELKAIDSESRGKEFFMGFARLILAMKRCAKFILCRVHGKAVGGGVGMVAASDYSFALDNASIKLSELAVGIGPFVVGPAVARRVGMGGFSALSIDTDWRDAAWAERHGLYSRVFGDIDTLDTALARLADTLVKSNPEAMARLKKVFWEGTEAWDDLLAERAADSGALVLSDFTVNAIAAFSKR